MIALPIHLIPIVALLLPVFIVGIVFWYKAREKELQYHQDLRIREMAHQQKMMEMQIDLEKVKTGQGPEKTA